MRRTKKRKISRKNKTKKVYDKEDFSSGDGMLTSVWGPSLWHYLHTMSFNYPDKPTKQDKKNYKNFIYSLINVLPCKYCRINLRRKLFRIYNLSKSILYIFSIHKIKHLI